MGDQNTVQNRQEKIFVKPEIKISPNKLEAYIMLKPDPSGIEVNLRNLFNLLKQSGIINKAIDMTAVESIVRDMPIGVPVRVAKGVDSGIGTDAKLVFHFQLETNLTPKEKEDGRVDFKELEIVQKVRLGDVLVQKIPQVPGKPGVNVLGQEIPPKPGKDYPMPLGRNVRLSNDKLKLYADMDGQVVYMDGKVSVLDVFKVDGDVSITTGNIDFNGNVYIKGNVQSGFKVRADGDIEVNGTVEMAELEAGGNIFIKGGFNGGEKGSLKAYGNIATKFIQAGTVTLGGVLETTYIYNSNVRCEDTVNMTGKGVILGGVVSARKRINAVVVGGDNAPKTTLDVGSDPDTVKRLNELTEEISGIEKNIKALESAVNMLKALKDEGKLPPEKEESLSKSEMVLEKLNESLELLNLEKVGVDERVAQLGKGFVAVKNCVYPGVVISMGSERFPINSKYSYTMFSREEGYIKTGPL